MIDENKKIILNRIKCNHCGDIIISYSQHDYKNCKCGKVSIDGGLSYLKRSFQEATDYEEMSLNEDSPFEVIRENLHWGTNGKSADRYRPISYISICEMSNAHLMAILRREKEGSHWIRGMFAKELEYRKENKIFIDD